MSEPKALLVYFTFSQQTRRVVAVMEEALAEKGYDVTSSAIEFTDPHWSKLFSELPMRRPALRIPTILIAQRRRKTGEIRIPEEAQSGGYNLVVIGSPTWWLTTNMPVRSAKSPRPEPSCTAGRCGVLGLAALLEGEHARRREARRGQRRQVAGRSHFTADGGQVESMLSWLAYMKSGQPRERILGVKMPKPNLSPASSNESTHLHRPGHDQEPSVRSRSHPSTDE